MPRPVLNPRKPRKILYLMIGFAALYWFGVRHGLGREEAQTLKVVRAPSPKRSKLEWTRDGYVKPTLDGNAEHPISVYCPARSADRSRAHGEGSRQV